ALVLRFLQQQPFHGVSTQLGISEDAAKKRVSRGLQKLRKIFSRRGITFSVAILAAAMAAMPAVAAPPALAASVATHTFATAQGLGTAASIAHGAMKAMMWVKLKLFGAAAMAVLSIATCGALVMHTMAQSPDSVRPPAAAIGPAALDDYQFML